MYIDFHTHGKLAKKLPFSKEYTFWLFEEAKRSGLDSICLTEHFNTIEFEKLYDFVQTNGEKDGDSYMVNGLRIFPGMETDIAEVGHILSIGPMDAILELNRRLSPFKEKKSFLSYHDLLNLFVEYPIIVGAAHAYRLGGKIPSLPQQELRRLDFLDLNGKDVAENYEKTKKSIYKLAKQLEKPVVAGSDTHQAIQYGTVVTNMHREITTVNMLREEMIAGSYEIEISKDATEQVHAAGTLKKELKAIYARGEDYVKVLTGKDTSKKRSSDSYVPSISTGV